MNTTSLREYVYRTTAEEIDPPLTRRDITYIIGVIFEGLTLGLTDEEFKEDDGYAVLIRKFGKFIRLTRKGRSYKIHDKIVDVPDRETVVFRPGTGLMERITGLGVDSDE